MTDRNYRLVFGLAILLALYFDLTYFMYGLISLIFVEGITNWRVPLLVNRFMQPPGADVPPIEPFDFRWPLQVERAWRLVVAFMLFLTAVLFNEVVWFLPWFMGFAILGAGVSGVCPMLLGLRFSGCRP
jgi:small-conductance mechanosensitive channel